MKYSDYLKNLKACPFCNTNNIILKENEKAFLTYSIAPYHQDHLMVIPKRHIEHILDLTTDESKDIDSLQRSALEILNELGHTNVSVLVKEGDKTEKTVAHTHYHIIPEIILSSLDHTGIDRKVLDNDEVTNLISRLKSVII